MHVALLQENLLKALTRAGRIVSSKAQLPIMQNVLLQATTTDFTVTSTSLEMSEIVAAPSKIEKQGGLCVSSRLLTDLVVSLPAETVRLVVSEGALHVRCGRVNATIPGVPAEEFPPISALVKKTAESFSQKTLIDALSGVLFAAATDEGRPILTGVKIVTTKDESSLVATDGYRLSIKKLGKPLSSDMDLIVPARALSEVAKIAHEEKDTKDIQMVLASDGQLAFVVKDTEVRTRTIVGEYPAIEKIIPKSHNTRVLMDTAQLARAVKSAAVFARDSANILRFHIDNQAVTVSSNTPQVGENHIEVEAKVDGEGGDIAFNSRFLIELLGNVTSDELMFEMTGSLNPGVFKTPKDLSYMHIIMPVRVQG